MDLARIHAPAVHDAGETPALPALRDFCSSRPAPGAIISTRRLVKSVKKPGALRNRYLGFAIIETKVMK